MKGQMRLIQDDSRWDELFEKFSEKLLKQPWIWRRFVEYSDRVRAKRDQYGAQTIIEVMRWHIAISGSEEDFKLNNNDVAFLSRCYMVHRDCWGFFRVRKQPSKDQSPKGERPVKIDPPDERDPERDIKFIRLIQMLEVDDG